MTTLSTLPLPWEVLLAFVLGIIIGSGIALLFCKGRGLNAKLQSQVQGLEEELARYRKKINEHFSTTAQMVNQLTAHYQNIHHHLASGANDLCADNNVKEQFQNSLVNASTIMEAENDNPEKKQIATGIPKDYAS